MLLNKKLVLASASPRRRQLLRQIGFHFEVRVSGVDEDARPAGDPRRHVEALSERKAAAVAGAVEDGIIIGADTIVVVDERILGKPGDAAEASEMLRLLSGRSHEVYTGFTLLDRPSNKRTAAVEITRVTFRTLSEDEIGEYVSSRSPMDKAGAYGIQDDRGAVFVERIDGCFYNVVGFPLTRFYVTLREFLKQLNAG